MKYHEDRLKAIDGAMKDRILQLHQIMAKGGLAVLAELLEKCFDTTTGKLKGMKLFHRKKHSLNHSMYNNNPIELLDASQSVETIYKNAVVKRNSSSSEDDIMELSGPVLDDMFCS